MLSPKKLARLRNVYFLRNPFQRVIYDYIRNHNIFHEIILNFIIMSLTWQKQIALRADVLWINKYDEKTFKVKSNFIMF